MKTRHENHGNICIQITVGFDVVNDALPNHKGWIYVSLDVNKPDRCKVGQTAGPLFDRTGTKTENPGYLRCIGFQVPADEALAIERYLHRKIDAVRIEHMSSGNRSEWFLEQASVVVGNIQWLLAKCLGGYIDEDGKVDLSEIVWVLPLDFLFRDHLKVSISEKQYYFVRNQVNGARTVLGLSPDSQEDMYAYVPTPRLGHGRNQ